MLRIAMIYGTAVLTLGVVASTADCRGTTFSRDLTALAKPAATSTEDPRPEIWQPGERPAPHLEPRASSAVDAPRAEGLEDGVR